MMKEKKHTPGPVLSSNHVLTIEPLTVVAPSPWLHFCRTEPVPNLAATRCALTVVTSSSCPTLQQWSRTLTTVASNLCPASELKLQWSERGRRDQGKYKGGKFSIWGKIRKEDVKNERGERLSKRREDEKQKFECPYMITLYLLVFLTFPFSILFLKLFIVYNYLDFLFFRYLKIPANTYSFSL